MMKIKNIIGVLFLLFLLISWENKTNEFELEKTVFTQILPSLVDSICVDSRLVSPPPFLGGFVTDEKGHVSVDSTKATAEQKVKYAEWKKLKVKAQQDTSSVFIAFNPLIERGSQSEFSFKDKDTIKSFFLILIKSG